MTIHDPDLACRHVVELVTDYLEGALPAQNAAQLEQHLLICDACATFVDQHQTVVRSLEQLNQSQPSAAPEAARSAVLELFRRMHNAPEPGTEDP